MEMEIRIFGECEGEGDSVSSQSHIRFAILITEREIGTAMYIETAAVIKIMASKSRDIPLWTR